MSAARYLVGDVFEQLATLPDGSVDLVFTSPPFLALRSYLPADHPDKGKEIGSESTPADFIDRLLDVVEACDRVLAPHGSLVFELGDTFSGSGGAGGDYAPADPSNGTWAMRAEQPKFEGSAAKARAAADPRSSAPKYGRDREADEAEGIPPSRLRTHRHLPGWPLEKSLCGIPDLFQQSLAYGRNLLNPERETPPWRIRNKVPWCRPNPPVGALGDKWRPSTSYLTVACKSKTRWFDLDAVRVPASDNTHARTAAGVESRPNDGKTSPDGNRATLAIEHQSTSAPPKDYLILPTQPYKGAHYATFPEALPQPFIECMCPREVCRVCGEPRRRITGAPEYVQTRGGGTPAVMKWRDGRDVGGGVLSPETRGGDNGASRVVETLGWTDCECATGIDTGDFRWRRGVVLDPFAGSGTTLKVAVELGREAIGIDLDERNADLAQQRCGMFLAMG